jgi:hypothetical protein
MISLMPTRVAWSIIGLAIGSGVTIAIVSGGGELALAGMLVSLGLVGACIAYSVDGGTNMGITFQQR